HMGQTASAVTRFLSEFALSGSLDGLPGMYPARWHLPRDAAGHVAVLLDEQNRVGIHKGQHANALVAGHHAINGGASIGYFHQVFTHRDPFILVYRFGGERFPRRLGERFHSVYSRKNCRVCRGSLALVCVSIARKRCRSSIVSMSNQEGSQAMF